MEWDSAYLAYGLIFLGLESRSVHKVVYKFLTYLKDIYSDCINFLDNTVCWAGGAILKSRTDNWLTYSDWHLFGF